MSHSDLILTPTGCTDEQAQQLTDRMAKSAARRGLPADELRDALEALGLIGPARRVSLGARDNIGRLRQQPAPATAQPEPEPEPAVGIPSGQHGHNGMCASGDHPWVAENIRPATGTTGVRCRACEQRRKRGGSSRTEVGTDLCRCPGRKHVLTAETSESTYVSPNGQRVCKVGVERRRQAEQAARDVAAEECAS